MRPAGADGRERERDEQAKASALHNVVTSTAGGSTPVRRLGESKEERRMGILAWIIFGLIVGLVARWIVPGEGPGGIIGDIIVGIIGALVGGWLYGFFGHTGVTGFNLTEHGLRVDRRGRSILDRARDPRAGRPSEGRDPRRGS